METKIYHTEYDVDLEISDMIDKMKNLMKDVKILRDAADSRSAKKTWFRRVNNKLQDAYNSLMEIENIDDIGNF